MTFEQACRELGISEAELEQLVAAGEIASIKEGDTLYFKRDALQRYKESRDKEATILLADDEINLLDDDIEEIDLLGDDDAGTPDTERVSAPSPRALDLGGEGEIHLDLDASDSETAEMPARKKRQEVVASSNDETILNLDGLLEEEAEGTTPIPGVAGGLIESEAGSLGDDTLLDTELLDPGEDSDTFDVDTAEDLTVEDATEQGTLLRGGGARVMQMKRKQSHAKWTAVLAVSAIVLLLPLGVLTTIVYGSSPESPTGVPPEASSAWIRDFNFLDGAIKWIADLFRQ
jgi:excisionase family DNA binding protein